jgi:hypothetical protein
VERIVAVPVFGFAPVVAVALGEVLPPVFDFVRFMFPMPFNPKPELEFALVGRAGPFPMPFNPKPELEFALVGRAGPFPMPFNPKPELEFE